MTDKLIGYLVAAGCLSVLGWTLRQWWRASRKGYTYTVRGKKR